MKGSLTVLAIMLAVVVAVTLMVWIVRTGRAYAEDRYVVESLHVDSEIRVDVYAEVFTEMSQTLYCDVVRGGNSFLGTGESVFGFKVLGGISRPQSASDIDLEVASFDDGAVIALYEPRDPFTLIMIGEVDTGRSWPRVNADDGMNEDFEVGAVLLARVKKSTGQDLYRLGTIDPYD